MFRQKMLINASVDERRIAILEKNSLNDFLIEHRTSGQLKGNIYRGVVVKVQNSIQAAFVDFGEEKNGFLALSDLNFSLYPPLKEATPQTKNQIQGRLKVGTKVIVQVTRDAIDHKGASLTTNISIPGRFMVFLANSTSGGVSKKIEDQEERQRLKDFISGIEGEKDSVIIRTAGVGRSLAELKKDYTMLKRTWSHVQKEVKTEDNPGLIMEEEDIVLRALRDYYNADVEEIWVDDPEVFQKALNFMKTAVPKRQKDLKLFVGDRSLFAAYGIEKEVEQLTERNVPLRSGGSLVIDQTEALVSVDVNSGRSSKGVSIEETATQTNIEAAKEIARQLRLRNLGGLVVVDFIDMEEKKNQKEVEKTITNAMKSDKAQHTIGSISQFGLLELSRQRLASGLSKTIHTVCPTCQGRGIIPSLFSSSNSILRTIRNKAAASNIEVFEANVPLETANYLLNEKREELTNLELEFDIKIKLNARTDIQVFNPNSIQVTKASQISEEEPVETIDTVEEEEVETPKKSFKKSRPQRKDTFEKRESEEKTQKQLDVDPKVLAEELFQKALNVETDMHPCCKYGDITLPTGEKLQQLLDSFQETLSGKNEEKKKPLINPKFLWTPNKIISSTFLDFKENEVSVNSSIKEIIERENSKSEDQAEGSSVEETTEVEEDKKPVEPENLQTEEVSKKQDDEVQSDRRPLSDLEPKIPDEPENLANLFKDDASKNKGQEKNKREKVKETKRIKSNSSSKKNPVSEKKPIRIFEFAKELKVTSKAVIQAAQKIGYEFKNHFASLSSEQVEKIQQNLSLDGKSPTSKKTSSKKSGERKEDSLEAV